MMPGKRPDYSMNKWARRIGFAFIILGVLITLSWFIDPVWQVLHLFRKLPVPLQLGLGVAAVGLTVLMISLLAERWSDRDADSALREDTPVRPPTPPSA